MEMGPAEDVSRLLKKEREMELEKND